MAIPSKTEYLSKLCDTLATRWPEALCPVHIVCHGHSVPAGFFCTPFVNPFAAYPHLLREMLQERFPYAVMNVIVTAIGGENSEQGAERFEQDVLALRPSLITLDYGLNDRGIGLVRAEKAWRSMIRSAQERQIPMILLTPSWDNGYYTDSTAWRELAMHAKQIRRLAAEYGTGLADSYRAFESYVEKGGGLQNLLSHVNHPSKEGHTLIAKEIAAWFVAR